MLMEYVEEKRGKINHYLEEFFHQVLSSVDDPLNKMVFEEVKRFTSLPGKRLRPLLVLLGYQGVKGREPPETVYRAAISVELLHSYLLIHDDIMDRDPIRRNAPTTWKNLEIVLGGMGIRDIHTVISVAIIAGDVAEALAARSLEWAGLDTDTMGKVLRKLHENSLYAGMGQALDVLLVKIPLKRVNVEDILKVYEYKTGRYTMEGPLAVGATLAGTTDVIYREYAIPVGMAFQIKDDILGLFGEHTVTGKPTDSDIREGKKTLMVWYAYHHGDREQRKVITHYLGKEDLSPEEAEEFRDVLVETGALDYAESKAREFMERGVSALESLDIDGRVKEILRELAVYIIERKK